MAVTSSNIQLYQEEVVYNDKSLLCQNQLDY